MMIYEHVLEGCAPVPLAGYLKALGVFRLIAEQKDSAARGFWRNERFVLKTRLAKDELIHFFLNDFCPTPIISPWNGGSGFYLQEGKKKGKDPITGKRVKTGVRDQQTKATRNLEKILSSEAERLRRYREAIKSAKACLTAFNLDSAPKDDQKASLIRELRSAALDAAVTWIDTSSTVTQRSLVFPPLLGSGGNDGNSDYSAMIIKAIASLIDVQSGAPLVAAEPALVACLFSDLTTTGGSAAISQFAPAAVGAPNSSVGFNGASLGNAWDDVLALEGTLVMSAATARRIGVNGKDSASFPFMIARQGVFGAGAGNVAPADENNARGEYWAPLWHRPAAITEVLALFREGRAIVDIKIANDALDFAQALGRLGVDRGIEQFQRYAFEQRFGNMYLGVPLERHNVSRNSNADLIAELTLSGWLRSVRNAIREKIASDGKSERETKATKNVSEFMLGLGRRLDDALFRLATEKSSEAVQEGLIAVGEIALACAHRPKLRITNKKNGQPPLPPPPRLSAEWTVSADDGSNEFALAAAIASLDATSASDENCYRLPFRRHVAPIHVVAEKRRVGDGWCDIGDEWDENTEAHVLRVWTGRNLVRDMGLVLERRLIEAHRRGFSRQVDPGQLPELELPMHGWRYAPLSAVTAFLEGRTDDDRIAALALGLAWARTSAPATDAFVREDALPFAYASLKPLFTHSGIVDDRGRRLFDPLSLVQLLRAGRGGEAVARAQSMARGAGLATPFASRSQIAAPRPERLAAALLFPVPPEAVKILVKRVYSCMNAEEENTDVV